MCVCYNSVLGLRGELTYNIKQSKGPEEAAIIVTTATATQHNLNTVVGFDTKMTVHCIAHPTHHRNSTETLRSLMLARACGVPAVVVGAVDCWQ